MSAPAQPPSAAYPGGAPPSAEYVPAPTQFGNLEMAGANPQIRAPLNQELTIAKLENTMASMEDQNLSNDPRFHQIARLKKRLNGQPISAADAAHSESSSNGAEEPTGKDAFTAENRQQLRAQVDVYKILARQETVPAQLSSAAIKLKPNSLLPDPFEHPGESETGEKLPYDMMKVFQIHASRSNNRRSTVNTPPAIDPQYLLKERENRLQNRIGSRIRDLLSLPAGIPPHLNLRAQIELRALRLVNFQQQMRREVMGQLKRDSTLETSLNPHAYRRVKNQNLREARVTERLEKQQKLEQEKRRRQLHMELLQAIIQQGKEFKEFHRNNQIKNSKLRKAVVTYHANSERERQKTEQKNEKLRMMKLIQEDEEGYRQLLDEKKDQRLVYLLQQTDEFVNSLTGLVRAHQATEKTRKSTARKEERKKQMEGRTPVRSLTTGQVLRGDDAPRTEHLEAWMNANPGYEIISVDDIEDSGDEDFSQNPVTEDKKEDKDDEFEGLDEEQRNKKIIEKARNEDDDYDLKSKMQLESYYATAHRIREKIVKQHSSMGGGNPDLQLKPYQIKGLEWMVSLYNNNLNGILADEMGLGKTIQTVALVTYLMEVKKVNGPYLIIVPLSTISNWALELEKWAPHVHKIVYKGDRDTRKRMDATIKRGAFNVLLTTYDYVLKEKALLGKLAWKYMIIDEGHRMKNHNCKLSLILNKEFQAQHRILLTGTPLQNKLPELWALLNFLLPSIFSSCHTFEQWFNAPFATTGEKVELNQEETMLIIRRLHKVLRPFLLRRLKKEVESQLPDKTEYLLKCDMSALQKILYRHMQKGFLIDQRNPNGTRALANTLMHLRKLCNHPFLFENVEQDCKEFWKMEHITGKELYRVSGKFELLDRILPKLKASGHRVLIFCQMTSLMNVMEDYFLYRQWKYLRLDGSTKPDERGELLKLYNAPNSEYFIFMLSTRAGGLGLNLQTADTVVIFDSDWNPHQDMQAQDRAHRIGQKREVRVFRLITVNSVEERILAAAKYKLNMDSKVIQAGKFDQRSTAAERRQMLERIIQEDQSDDEEEDDVPDDDAINEMLAREPKELDWFMKMDIDRRRAEAEVDPRHRKPRLVEEDEIPENILKFEEKFTTDGELIGDTSFADMGMEGGRRRRREVDYSADLMSEQEFMRQLEDDEDEETSRSSSKRSRRSEKAGRPKRKRVELDDDDDEEDSRGGSAGGNTPSRKRNRGANSEFVEIVNRCIRGLLDYTSSSGRRIAEVFESLPSRRELPDYYDVIERPMDIRRIQKKLADGRYSTLEDVTADMKLLGNNARKYNADGSDIYNDSILLEAVWKQYVDSVDRPVSSASTQNSSSGDATPSGVHRARQN